jgi:hypothetical protein
MARQSKRERQRVREQRILASVVAILIAAVFVFVTWYMRSAAPPLNSENLCPAEGPKGHYVLLVDKTDPLTFSQKNAFSVTLRDFVRKRTPEGYLLSVFVLGEDFTATAKPLVELCNPGTGESKSELTANLKQLKRQYHERFESPLLKTSEDMVANSSAKFSPILEMLQLVGINGFRKNDVDGERRLFIISDMLHNTSDFTMYRGIPDYEALANTSYGRKVHSDLTGVEVEILYLINTPQLQTKRNVKFWEDYFQSAGARIVAVKPL